VRNRLRSVPRRVLTIGYQARSPKTRTALVQSYRRLRAAARAGQRDAATMVRRLGQRVRTARATTHPILQHALAHLRQMRPVVQRVLAQTRARVLGGDTHVPDKVLSLFEPQTATTHKGKISTPNEFGNLVTIQEAEHQIVTAYEIHAARSADVTLWTPALDRHQAIFGRAPDFAAGDRGFSSATNEQAATDRGIRRVIVPRRGPSRPRGVPMSATTGSAAANAGASGAKAACVCSNVAMACAAVATMASTACTAGSASV
jgi:hypothetical protein